MKPAKIIAMAAGAAALALTGSPRTRPANAVQSPRVIEVVAKKYDFTPAEITLKKGEPVILRLTSADRTHGFLLKPYKIDTDIVPGKSTDIALTPFATGQYVIICDHYCGIGHGNMKLQLKVVD